MKETPTITACIVDGCEKPGTRHADYQGASWYCDEHGVCGSCGLSVEHFTHVVDQGVTNKGHQWSLDIWVCQCVADRRYAAEPQRVVVESKVVVELPKKTVVNYWSTTASH